MLGSYYKVIMQHIGCGFGSRRVSGPQTEEICRHEIRASRPYMEKCDRAPRAPAVSLFFPRTGYESAPFLFDRGPERVVPGNRSAVKHGSLILKRQRCLLIDGRQAWLF